jgi:hypothetical protein
MALDPELVLIGVQAQVGPLFNPNVFLRPNAEFAFGEVTALFALNMEAIYRLPVSSRQGPLVGVRRSRTGGSTSYTKTLSRQPARARRSTLAIFTAA